MIKELFSNRTPFEKCYLVENVKQLSFINLRMAHVKRIFKAFLDPPIYVLPNGQVLDLAAFRMLKEKYPENKTAIRVMVVDSDKSPLQLAIRSLNPAKSGRERMKICFGKSS